MTPGAAIRPPTDREFALFRALILREAGINLSEAKRALLAGRLSRRLRELGLSTFDAYYRLVGEEGTEEERTRMIDCICTNETHFFREPRQFGFLEERVFPEWRAQADSGARPRKVSVWSAACSTGEEPYSLAMALLWHLPPSAGWEVEILGTDLSTRVLQQAGAALWRLEKSAEIPPRYLKAFMLRGKRSQEGRMMAGPEIRAVVRFQRVNLQDEVSDVPGHFDLIFCRNVLIYFNAVSKLRVVGRLLDRLSPGGYLFLGHAESLSGLTRRARGAGPNVYTRVDAAEASAGSRPGAAPSTVAAGRAADPGRRAASW